MNANSELTPITPNFYAVGDKVTRTGMLYVVTELRVDNKYGLRRINRDGSFDTTDTRTYRFEAKDLHPFE